MPPYFRRLICIPLLSGIGQTVQAAEWEIAPLISSRVGYNDNLRLNTNNKVSTAEITFSPSARFSVNTPTSGISGNLDLDFRRYEADSDLNDDNASLKIASFYNTERSRVGLDLDFIQDTTLDSQLEETGFVFERIRRQRANITPSWSYSMSERTRFTTTYSYSDIVYKNADNTGFVDFTQNSFQASLTRIVNERSVASLTLSRFMTNNENDIQSINTNLQTGVSYRFSETLSTSLFIGIRRTEVEYSQNSEIPIRSGNTIIGSFLVASNISNSDWGTTYNASINKSFSQGEMSLSASRSISSDINGQPIEITRIRTVGAYRLTAILTASLNLELYNGETNNSIGNNLNRDYYVIEPKFRWSPKEFWSFSGSYRYTRQTLDTNSDDITQNAAYLTLIYRWPRIAVSR